MVQIRPGSPTRYTQHLSNFRVRKALDIMEDNHRARTIGKLGKRGLQPLPQLVTLGWIAKRSRHRIRQLLRVPHLTTTGQIESCVCDDAIQPGSECLRRIEPIQRLMRPQKSFLHRIFRILVRQDDRARYRIRPSLMQSNKPGETPVVSPLCETDELSFFIRNTNWMAGLLGQMRFHRSLLQTYWRPAGHVGLVDARQGPA